MGMGVFLPEFLDDRALGDGLLDQGAGQLFVELADLGQTGFELVA